MNNAHERKIEVLVDPTAVGGPLLNLLLSIPLPPGTENEKHNRLTARRERWADAADELTKPLRNLEAPPAAATVANLVAAIKTTETAIAEAQTQLVRTNSRIADELGRGRDPAQVEAEAATLSAKMVSLQGRLPILKSKLAEARAAQNAQHSQAEAEARAKLQGELKARIDAIAARFIAKDIDRTIDELAALQNALGALLR